MKRQAADHDVEGRVVKRKILRVGWAKRDVRQTARCSALLSNQEHGVGEIDANHFARSASDRFGDIARPRGNVEDAFMAGETRDGDQAANAVSVSDPGIRGEGLRLRGERFADYVVVLGHPYASLCGHQEYHRDAAAWHPPIS